VPDPSDTDLGMKNIIICDDIATEKNQNPTDNFYTRGRHNNCISIRFNETHKVPYSFVLINKDEHLGSGKYFKNLNQLYIPQKYFSGNRSRLSPEFSVKECSIGVNDR
jgi:hypothetical protein